MSSLRRHATTAFHAVTLITYMAASAAPTPLYRIYQERWGFSPVLLTVIFAVYAFSLLAALLTTGALSDHLGRRPVIFIALALQIFAMAMFIAAASTGWLIAARIVQGFATGLATSALSAGLLDSNRAQAPLINSLIPPAGMALGALGSAGLVAFAPWPRHLVFALLLASFALQALLLWRIPETAAPRPGALAALRPRVSVPPHARPAFLRALPANVAVWALGGFFLSLMPSLIRAATGTTSVLAGGLAVAALTASGAAAILTLRRRSAELMLSAGTAILAVGLATILGGVHARLLPLLFGGTLITGFGWGASFLGGLRTLLPAAGPGERAGLMAAFYIESYLAMSLPAIAIGAAVRRIGLIAAADLYGSGLLLLTLLAFLAALRRRPAADPAEAGDRDPSGWPDVSRTSAPGTKAP